MTEPPTTPGVYWVQGDGMSWEVMIDVRMTNGGLMVWWLTPEEDPVAQLNGHWRGPIAPSTRSGPG